MLAKQRGAALMQKDSSARHRWQVAATAKEGKQPRPLSIATCILARDTHHYTTKQNIDQPH